MSALSPHSAVRLLALLYLAGSALSLASMALPQPAGQSDAGIYAVIAISTATGVLLLLARQRPRVLLPVALLASTLLVAAGIWASNRPSSVYALFFVGVAVLAYTSLPRRAAHLQILAIAAAYGWVMLVEHPGGAAERWLITVGTALTVGLLAAALRQRVDGLVGELEATVAQLDRVASTDAMTGLTNRRGFDDAIALEFSRMRRGAQAFTLVLCDLDHFKLVNDALGHPGGDAVLRRVAEALRESVRGVDVVGRLGGEEFGLLLHDTDEAGAVVVAERLRSALERGFEGDEVPLTVTCGVAGAAEHPDAVALMYAADTALYAAKRLGRNRTMAYRPHLPAMLRFEAEAESSAGKTSPLRTLLALSEALDLRDCGTATHSVTVAEHAETMALALGLNPRRVARVRLAGLLHDIGKIGVSDAVLRKPGPLDDTEWAEMRAHPAIGARLLGPVVDDVSSWVLAHHERPDGQGYPHGITGDAIPIESRILAVADAYEAMTADRPYRTALGPEKAREELRRCAGAQFDPAVVEVFLEALPSSRSPLVTA